MPDRIRDMKEKISEQNLSIKEKTDALSDYTVKEICGRAQKGLSFAILENIGAKEARVILNKAIKAVPCVVLVFTEKNRLNYVLSSAEGSGYDCKYLCELLNGLYSGKGGGSPRFAQGGGNLCPDFKERGEIFLKTAVENK